MGSAVQAGQPHRQGAAGVEGHGRSVDSHRGLGGAAQREQEIGPLTGHGRVAGGVGPPALGILDEERQRVNARARDLEGEQQVGAAQLAGGEALLEASLPPRAEELAGDDEGRGGSVPGVLDVHADVQGFFGGDHHPRHLETRSGRQTGGGEDEKGEDQARGAASVSARGRR